MLTGLCGRREKKHPRGQNRGWDYRGVAGLAKFWSSCVSAYMMSLLVSDLASILFSERRSIIHSVASRPLITVHETGQRRRTGWPTVRLVI